MGLTQDRIDAFGDLLYDKLSEAFPREDWHVIPEFNGHTMTFGYLVACRRTAPIHGATAPVGPYNVTCRPHLSIFDHAQLDTPEFVESILSAFEKILAAPHEPLVYRMAPCYRSYVIGEDGSAPITSPHETELPMLRMGFTSHQPSKDFMDDK